MRPALALLALAVVTGCSFDWGSLDPREGDATSSGGSGGEASTGGSASQGGGGGTVAAGGGGTGGEGAGVPVDCLSDTFTTPNDMVWTASTTGMGCSVNVDGEVAMVCVADPTSSSRSVTYRTIETHDVEACGVQVETVDITTDSGAGWHLRAELANGDLVKAGVVSGSLEFFVSVGSSTTQNTTNYDPVEMRWLRIKKDGNGCAELWTSPNGQTWLLRDEVCTAPDLSEAMVGLEAGAFNQPDQITVAYDNLGPS